MLTRDLTPAELAEKWRCSTEHILNLIRARHLQGFPISPPGSKRPRYRITAEAVSEYESRSQPKPITKAVRRQGRRNEGVIEFYK